MRRLLKFSKCIVLQPDGHEIGTHADRLEVDTTGAELYRFHGPHGAFLDLPSRKVLHARLVDKATPDRMPADKEDLQSNGTMH